jgi:subtilase family serine protease
MLKTKISVIKMNELKKKLLHISLFTITVVVLLFFIHTAAADYDFDGVPYTDQLKKVEQGSVKGGVIVDGGHGLGIAKGRPYEQVFSVPDGNITFSRLYVGVWGGTEKKTGKLETTFNDYEFDTLDLKGDEDINPEVYCSGHGVYWIVYDTIDYVQSGTNKAVARTSGEIDGRVYCIILVTVYEDDNGESVDYWINEGNPNLHSLGWSGDLGSTNDEAYVKFSGINVNEASAARLTVAYLCGTEDENDYLYFNDNKLNGDDVAASRDYFDLLTFDVSGYLEKSSEALFERGDEDYIHPVLAVLTVYKGELKEESDLVVGQVTIPELYTDEDNIITINIKNIGTSNAFGFSTALYCDEKRVSKGEISSIICGENRSVNLTWKPEYSGHHVLRVMADYTDLVPERRETNNNNTPISVNIIDYTPPNITISSPSYNQVITSDVLIVEGDIEETDNNITVSVNGIEAVLSGKKWSAQVELEQGRNWIIVDATDGANNTATEFVIVSCEYDGTLHNGSSSGGLGIDTNNNSDININSSANSSTNSSFNSSVNSSADVQEPIFTSSFIGAGSLIGLILIIYLIRRQS